MSPDGSTNQLTLKPDLLYQRFGMACKKIFYYDFLSIFCLKKKIYKLKGRLRDESESIFSYTGSWNFDTFHDQRPMIKEWQRFRPWFTHTQIPFPSNVTFS